MTKANHTVIVDFGCGQYKQLERDGLRQAEFCPRHTMMMNTKKTYNTVVTDATSEILGKERRRKKPWVIKDVLDLCDERRDLKKKRYEAEGAKKYREASRRIQKAVKKAKEDWIGAQCEEIETCLNKNTSKRAYQLVKDLTLEKQSGSSTIQDKSGRCLTEEKEILSR